MQRIVFERPAIEVEQVKRKLKAKSFGEVGRETFLYFYRRECE